MKKWELFLDINQVITPNLRPFYSFFNFFQSLDHHYIISIIHRIKAKLYKVGKSQSFRPDIQFIFIFPVLQRYKPCSRNFNNQQQLKKKKKGWGKFTKQANWFSLSALNCREAWGDSENSERQDLFCSGTHLQVISPACWSQQNNK